MTEDTFRALVARARQVVAEPERESLREAKRERRAALSGYVAAMRAMPMHDEAAIKRYQAAITTEAAAHRAEARELRELLAAIVGVTSVGAR